MSSVSVVEWQGHLNTSVVGGPRIKEEQKLRISILEHHNCSSGKAFLFHIQSCHVQSMTANSVAIYKASMA